MDAKSPYARLRRHPLRRYRYTRQRWCALFSAVDVIGSTLMGLAMLLARFLPRLGRQHLGDPKRILLVQLDHLGDAVITTAMLPPLRRRFPDAAIEVLASPWNQEVFEAAPEVDRVFVSRNNRFARARNCSWPLAILWWGIRLRRRRFDLAVDVRGEFPFAVLLWLSGAGRRLGWDSGGGGFLLTDSPAYVPGRPEVESRMALLAELGVKPQATTGPAAPNIVPTAPARETASQRWLAVESEAGGPVRRVVLHVGAGMPAKRWPVEYWRQLLNDLTAEKTVQVVLVGGAADRIIARHILGNGLRPRVADWTGQLTFGQLAAALEQADLLVGADSGPAHVAAAVGTAVVALFSGTNSVRQWRPTGSSVEVVCHPVACGPCHKNECPLADHPCMRGVSPSMVFEAIRRQFSCADEQLRTPARQGI
ncbi:MAG: glycosyltransferase family 9 protein [Rhodopirellula sp.]|nr:glycosyltransferase family 9 protein [Rhodopirellula sp.]